MEINNLDKIVKAIVETKGILPTSDGEQKHQKPYPHWARVVLCKKDIASNWWEDIKWYAGQYYIGGVEANPKCFDVICTPDEYEYVLSGLRKLYQWFSAAYTCSASNFHDWLSPNSTVYTAQVRAYRHHSDWLSDTSTGSTIKASDLSTDSVKSSTALVVGETYRVSYEPQLGRVWPDAEILAIHDEYVWFTRKGRAKPLMRRLDKVKFYPQLTEQEKLDNAVEGLIRDFNQPALTMVINGVQRLADKGIVDLVKLKEHYNA